MSYNNGPKIVTNGLVLYLDAANNRSYPGSGTVWTDITKNGNNGTLTNGPTFNAANIGSIVFDGTNDYVQTSGTVINIAANWSTNVWFKTNGSTNIGSLVVRGLAAENTQWRCEVQASTGKVNFLMRNPSDQSILGTTSTNDNRWHMATYTNTSGLVRIYLDGNLENSATITNLGDIASSNLVLGRLGDSGGPYYYNGSIAQASVYNRALSAEEIRQNYHASKGRFGL
jgi:hypothetical protein